MQSLRKIIAVTLLVAIGLPAGLGVGLHWVQDAFRSEAFAAQNSCGPDCPFNHHAPTDDDHVATDSFCLLCGFLATAQQAQVSRSPLVLLERIPTASCIFEDWHDIAEPVKLDWARGPPA